MGLFAPLALAGLALAAPIIALYFLRLRRPERRVSSTFLWSQVLRDVEANTPWQRLRPNLLLLLQLLALAGLALALARPYVLLAGEAPGEHIVLLDGSASMLAVEGGQDRFALAQSEVRGLIDSMGPETAVTLVLMADVPQVLLARSTDAGALRDALRQARPSYREADLTASLSLAAALAKDRPRARVTVVSDGNTRTADTGALPVPVRYLPVGTERPNWAIAAFAVRLMEGRSAALARVVNTGTQAGEMTLELMADGRPIDVRRLALASEGEQDLVWSDLPLDARLLQVRLTGDDALAVDNAAWAIAGTAEAARVLLVTEGNVFLETALRLMPWFQVTKVAPGAYTPLEAHDLTIFDTFLPAALPAGSMLVIGPPEGTSPFPVGGGTGVSTLSFASDDSLLSSVDLTGVHILRARIMTPPAAARTVLSAPETPLLVIQEQADRRLAVLGFDLHDSDLPLQLAFPVLVQNLAEWLLPGVTGTTGAYAPGDPVPVPARSGATRLRVVAPDSTTTDLAPALPAAVFGGADLPGPYRVIQEAGGQQQERMFVVNFFSPLESRLAPAPALPATGLEVEGETGKEQSPLEFSWLVMATVLGLLSLEWWVYHRGV